MIKIITCITEKGDALLVVNELEEENPTAGESQIVEGLKKVVSLTVGSYLEFLSRGPRADAKHIMQQGRVIIEGETFVIVEERDNTRAIVCLKCGKRSHNAQDVENRYCGSCHTYHEATPTNF